MYGWDISEGRYYLNKMGILESETSCNMKTVGIMLQLTRVICAEFTICVGRNLYELTKTEICINNLLSSFLDR